MSTYIGGKCRHCEKATKGYSVLALTCENAAKNYWLWNSGNIQPNVTRAVKMTLVYVDVLGRKNKIWAFLPLVLTENLVAPLPIHLHHACSFSLHSGRMSEMIGAQRKQTKRWLHYNLQCFWSCLPRTNTNGSFLLLVLHLLKWHR